LAIIYHPRRIHPFLRKQLMMKMISLIIDALLLLIKGTMLGIRVTTLPSTVRRTRHPGSRKDFHLLADNRRLRRESLAVSGEYLLDLIMSMGINGIPLIYNVRIDVVLLVRNRLGITGRRSQTFHKASNNRFLDLVLPLPETATMTRLRTYRSHRWLN